MNTISVKQFLIALFVLGCSLSACKKSKEDNIKVTVNNIAGTYKITALSFEGNDGSKEDEFQYLDECQKNALQIFYTDLNYEEEDNCYPSSSHSGTWSLPSSNKIVIYGDTDDIVSFDGHVLVIYIYGYSGGIEGKMKETLTKQ